MRIFSWPSWFSDLHSTTPVVRVAFRPCESIRESFFMLFNWPHMRKPSTSLQLRNPRLWINKSRRPLTSSFFRSVEIWIKSMAVPVPVRISSRKSTPKEENKANHLNTLNIKRSSHFLNTKRSNHVCYRFLSNHDIRTVQSRNESTAASGSIYWSMKYCSFTTNVRYFP